MSDKATNLSENSDDTREMARATLDSISRSPRENSDNKNSLNYVCMASSVEEDSRKDCVISNRATNENLHEDDEDVTSSDYSAQSSKDSPSKESTEDLSSSDSDNYKRHLFIDNLIRQIVTASRNDSLEDIADKLNELRDQSSHKYVALYLIKHDYLLLITNLLDDEPGLIRIFLRIIFAVCFNDTALELIGNNKKLANKILNYLKCDYNIVLHELFILLKLKIIRKIEQNARCSWIDRLKEYEFFENCIIVILNSARESLLLAAIQLIRAISLIRLTDRTYFLRNLFNMHKLIPALLTSYVRIISLERSHYSEIDSDFIDDWLSIMLRLEFKFKNFENNEYYIKLLRILYHILEPYQRLDILTPELQREKDAYVIYKSTKLISQFYRDFHVPSIIHRTLGNIIFCLKAVLASHSEKRSSQSEKLFQNLFDKLCKYWLNILEHYSSLQIIEIIFPCEENIRRYLINIGHNVESNLIRKKLKIIDTDFKQKIFFDAYRCIF